MNNKNVLRTFDDSKSINISKNYKDVVFEIVNDNFDKIESKFNVCETRDIEEQEIKTYSFASPNHNGAFEKTCFVDLCYMHTSGYFPSNEKIQEKLQTIIETDLELAKNTFIENENVDHIPKDKINYGDLEEIDYNLAELFDEYERENIDELIMFELSVYFYATDNDNNKFDNESVLITGAINCDNNLYRTGDEFEVRFERKFEIKETFKDDFEKAVKEIIEEML